MSRGSSCGTLSRAARTIVAVRSSGRASRSDPLTARPIGERAVATMTASGMRVTLPVLLNARLVEVPHTFGERSTVVAAGERAQHRQQHGAVGTGPEECR